MGFVTGFAAIDFGDSPTPMVAMTELLPPSMTETVSAPGPLPLFAAYTRFVVGLTATDSGWTPTGIVAIAAGTAAVGTESSAVTATRGTPINSRTNRAHRIAVSFRVNSPPGCPGLYARFRARQVLCRVVG